MPGSRVVVHLVHGTWPVSYWHSRFGRRLRARKSNWFDPASSFALRVGNELARGGYDAQFTSVYWIGRNSDKSRRQGMELLKATVEASDASQHLFISHSHGANVALGALRALPPELRAKCAGLIAMAAPFISSSSLELHPAEIALRAGSLLFVFLLPLVIGAALWYPVLGAAIAALAVSLPQLLSGTTIRRAAALGGQFDWASKPSIPVVVIRAPADEATLALALSDAISRFGGHGWRIVRLAATATGADRLVSSDLGRRLTALGYLAPFLIWILALDLDHLSFRILAILFVVALVPITLIGLPALGLAMGLGAGRGISSFFSRISVEATPTDWSGVVHCLPLGIEEGEAESTGPRLSHSIHAFRTVQELVAKEGLRLANEHRGPPGDC